MHQGGGKVAPKVCCVSGETPSSRTPARRLTFDAASLRRFLVDKIGGLEGSMCIEPVAGGQSNPTFLVAFDNRLLVLRKRPPGSLLPSAHAVDREYRVQRALAGSGVPVPEMLLYYEEPDVIGTPFYVMEHLEGRVLHDTALPGLKADERRAVYRSMAETLARLHAVDWQEVGLGDFGRPANYFPRQIDRWVRQWQLSKTRELPEMEHLVGWLINNVPENGDTTIVHGDFRLGNLMMHPTEPRVIGVLDWELSTLGDPLADLAHCCIAWHSAPEEYGGIRGLDLQSLGIPAEGEFLADYYRNCHHEARLGRFHLVFALFRFAAIFQGIAARAAAGNAVGQDASEVGMLAGAFSHRAIELLASPPPA